MGKSEAVEAASFFNSQPHINDVKSGLERDSLFKSKTYTFMLKHKHFDLSAGEVLWVAKVPLGYDVWVKEKQGLNQNAAPCMWLYNDGWTPFAYTHKKDGLEDPPNLPEGDYNLGVRWLNTGGLERTNVGARSQKVRPKDEKVGNFVVTMINMHECDTRCSTCAFYCASECLTCCDHNEDEGRSISYHGAIHTHTVHDVAGC